MTSPTVFIVDDDPGIRHSIPVLLETANLQSECFASAEAFLVACDPGREGCLLLDVRMPGMNGPSLQEELARRHMHMPIIFLTGYADVSTGVSAIKQGAVDFLTKPVNGALLLQRVQLALEQNHRQREADKTRRQFDERIQKLTQREREVLALALAGLANRDIATQLNISLRTIEGHRSRIYLKTGVASLLELAQQAAAAGSSVLEAVSSESGTAT